MPFSRIYMLCLVLASCFCKSNAQTLIIQVAKEETSLALPGAIIFTSDSVSLLTDSNGLAKFNINQQKETFIISHLGFFKKKVIYKSKKNVVVDTLHVLLEEEENEIQEVTVVTTKQKTNIENLATRVEAVDKDELTERSLDKPSDVSHAIKEQTGIQLQRTSGSSGAFNVRLQALRGKYVQILKDGMPLFGGLSEYLALPHTSPLSLNQIEIIKGPASTLYGGDAIAGVINFISAQPSAKPVYDVLLNVESTKSIDAGLYASHLFGKFGYTLLGQYRFQQPKDWDGDQFSDYAKIRRWTVSPDLYWFANSKIKISAGVTYTHEDRSGGAMPTLQGKTDTNYTYTETNRSEAIQSRFNTEMNFTSFRLTLRNGINYYKRDLTIPTYHFGGNQLASYSEAMFGFNIKRHKLLIGVDCRTDQFKETTVDTSTKRSYVFITPGLFVQETFVVNERTVIEAGLRVDYNFTYGAIPLPRLAWLQKWNDVFHTRINFGMGYKLPTIFQDESEQTNFQRVAAIDQSITKPEISLGGVVDMKVVSPSINGLRIIFNEMAFYTHILNPLMAATFLQNGEQHIHYLSQKGYIEGKGIETTLQFLYKGMGIKASYTLQDQSLKVNGATSVAPLTSKHILALFAGYEKQSRFSVGLDCYYFSPSQLVDGSETHGIWELGINGQIITKYVVFFANLENILNMRQSSFGPVVTPNPTYNQPVFKQIYGPLEGILFNIGVRIKLGSLIKGKVGNDAD